MGRLRDVLIDDHTWECASEARRHEWQQAIDDLLAEHRLGVAGDGPLRLHVVHAADRLAIELVDEVGTPLARASLPMTELGERIAEYVAICREMIGLRESQNSPRLEALDIAKRLTHDEGAELVSLYCRSLQPDHATARRLFTLMVTLRFDTTRLGPDEPPSHRAG